MKKTAVNTKGEKREKKRRNSRKMVVRGRSMFTILRIKAKKAEEAQKKLKPWDIKGIKK